MEVNHLSFNQNYSCIALGTKAGFSIYNLDPIDVSTALPPQSPSNLIFELSLCLSVSLSSISVSLFLSYFSPWPLSIYISVSLVLSPSLL
jgi:hypothetical protein